jgi:hypothetical protein
MFEIAFVLKSFILVYMHHCVLFIVVNKDVNMANTCNTNIDFAFKQFFFENSHYFELLNIHVVNYKGAI